MCVYARARVRVCKGGWATQIDILFRTDNVCTRPGPLGRAGKRFKRKSN